jgi:hypothetical protein
MRARGQRRQVGVGGDGRPGTTAPSLARRAEFDRTRRDRNAARVPPSFFVCYRREDAGYAAALSRALAEQHGPDRVFKDITSLPLAHDWRSEVAAAIGRSTHVLALIGPDWMAGVDQQGLRDGQPDPIVFELVEASRAGRAVVPVLLAGQRMPPAHRLPAPLRWLASLHSAHIRTESADTDIADLVYRLPQPPQRPPAPPRLDPPVRVAGRGVGRRRRGGVGGAQSTVPPPTTGPRRRGGLGAILTALVVIAVVVVAFTSGAVGSILGTDAKLTLNPAEGGPGTKVTATATGFSPRTTVLIRFYGIVGEGVADGDGRVEVEFIVPKQVSTSIYEVYANEEKDPFTSDSARFTVR